MRFNPTSDFNDSRQARLMVSREMHEKKSYSRQDVEEMMLKKHRKHINATKNDNEEE